MALQTVQRQNTPESSPDWLTSFPALTGIPDPAWLSVARSARKVNLQEGEPVFNDGDICRHLVLVYAGSVRVQKTSENGNIISLYHMTEGDVCELSVSCLLSGRAYSAEAVTESDTRIILIPAKPFHWALAESPQFRKFVFSSLGRSIDELLTLIEEVAFGHMEGRLARQLLSYNDISIECTHQKLAEELGSAREVISRLLKRFERHDWVRLHRGCIEIIDRKVLQQLASHIDR